MKKVLKKKKIIIPAAIVLVLVVAAAALLGGGNPGGGMPVTASTIERGDIKETIAIKGTVQGSDSADVYSGSNYRISNVTVEVGDQVTEGQILATLEASDLTDEYNKALISHNEAKRNYETSKILYEEGAVSQSEYLSAKAAYETSSLTLNSFDITENANVTSPISGTVTRVNATAGKLANSGSSNGEPLFVIENLEALQMKVKVSEYDISQIKVGQTAVISAEVLGKETVTGVVSHISPTGEQGDGSSGGMVIPVVISIDKGETNLIAGVTAKAEILVAEATNILTVPIDAIFEDADTELSYIFTISDDNILTKHQVETGVESSLYVEVSGEGLEEGQRVLLMPTYDHYDGMQVLVTEISGSDTSGNGDYIIYEP